MVEKIKNGRKKNIKKYKGKYLVVTG